MPKDYVVPNVNDDLQERLQTITQQILSRTWFLHIIEQFNLYAGGDSHLNPDEKVESMRKDIEIELVWNAGSNQVNAFNVYYWSRDPHLAQPEQQARVVGEILNFTSNVGSQTRQGRTSLAGCSGP